MKFRRRLAAVVLAAATLFLFSFSGPPAAAATVADCESQNGRQSVEACTSLLANKKLNKAARASLLLLRGLSHFRVGNFEEGQADLKEATRLAGEKSQIGSTAAMNASIHDPKTAEGNYWLALAATQPENGRDMSFFLDRAIALDPEHGLSRGQRGYMRFKSGDIEGAVKDLEIAMAHYPKKDYLQEERKLLEEILIKAREDLRKSRSAPSAEALAKAVDEARQLEPRKLCLRALNSVKNDFERDPNFKIFVDEAGHRALTARNCIDIVAQPETPAIDIKRVAQAFVQAVDAFSRENPQANLDLTIVRATVALNAAIEAGDQTAMQQHTATLLQLSQGNAALAARLRTEQEKLAEQTKADADKTLDQARMLAEFLRDFATDNMLDKRAQNALDLADKLSGPAGPELFKASEESATNLAALDLAASYSAFKTATCITAKRPGCD